MFGGDERVQLAPGLTFALGECGKVALACLGFFSLTVRLLARCALGLLAGPLLGLRLRRLEELADRAALGLGNPSLGGARIAKAPE